MAIIKNTASQGLYVYAHDTAADAAKTGDAANITATISLDGAAAGATNYVNPTEIGGGVYWFALTQAETNAGALALVPVSATGDVVLDPVIVLTQEAVITYQSGDAYARLGAPAGASVSADIAAIEALAAAGAAGDPWLTALPGAYAAGSAGEILGTLTTELRGADDDTHKTLSDQLDAIKSKTDLITTNGITVVTPVSADGDATIDAGYDYYAVDDRALEWTDETPATWPDLTAATATFRVGDLAVVAGITNPTGPATIAVELSKTQTATLAVGDHTFKIDCVLANTHLILQLRGILTVR